METEILQILLSEKEKLLQEKEKNLEKIKILDEKIEECEKKARHYSVVCYFNDCNIETYRRKTIVLREGLRFGLIKVISLAYENIRINFLEQENQFFEEKRAYYQNETIYHKENKKNLERENIDLGNKIFIIDNQLGKENNDYPKEKVLIKKEAKHDWYKTHKRKQRISKRKH